MTAGAMSLRGLARLMGVSEKAVRKALLAGVFSDAAVRRDAAGTPEVLNATIAVDEWEKSGRQLRGSTRPSAPSAAGPLVSAPPTAADGPGQAPRAAGELPAAVPADAQSQIEAMLAQVRTLRQGLAGSGPVPGVADDDGEPAVVADVTLVAAQRAAMIERGRKLRLENDLREGMLVEADQAAREAFEFARVVREAVLNIPARLSAELAAETDGARVYTRLDAALREALESTASRLEAAGVTATVEGERA